MICYICQEYDWCAKYVYKSWKDSGYDVNRSDIELFHTLHNENNTKTLSGLIELLNAYDRAYNNIIDCAQKAHLLCNLYCTACGRFYKKNKKNIKKHKDDEEEENNEESEEDGETEGSDEDSCDEENVCDGFQLPVPKKPAGEPAIWTRLIRYYLHIDHITQVTLNKLTAMRQEIHDIDNMIGMTEIKETFLRLVKTLAKTDRNKFTGYTNIVIGGPPGHGKTEIAKLLGKAFLKSGFLTNDVFVSATRTDLIGKYCGHTADATTKMFDKARGGVIFIDEVYSLGNKSKSDAFTGECIDTINLLTGERKDTLCIVAGYEHEIRERFFAYNDGLTRRFPWRFNISPYNEQNLVDIFFKLLKDHLINPENKEIFVVSDVNKEYFTNAGGDVANLITDCISCHHDNCFYVKIMAC